jgi:3-oxoadipate enol-lactonase
LAESYWRQLDEKNVDQINLVGHSMGGYVCLEMLAAQPSRVSSLALVHSHVFADTEEKRISRTQAMDEIKTKGRKGFVNKFIPPLFADPAKSTDIIDKLIARGMQFSDTAWYYGTAAIRDRRDQTDVLRNFHSPVLMMMGEDDKVVTTTLALKQASFAERTVLHMYPGVGHLGMYENTKQMIIDFIRFYADFSA